MALTPRTSAADGPGPTQDPRLAALAEEGYLGPVRLFTLAECQRIAAYLSDAEHPAPADWDKGRAVHERFLFDLATHPLLLSALTAALGEDVVLWGAQAVSRAPGAVHPWHSDIESCATDGRFVSVWIGIENTSRESALQMISRSHRLGKTVQEARLERGLRREMATAETMLAAALEIEPRASLVQPDMTNGDALLFDGRLWHGSDNTRKKGKRLALLFQYAAAESPVRIPLLSQLDWPFHLRAAPRPPAILVSGTDGLGINRLVPAPPPRSKGRPMVATTIHKFVLPSENPTKEWESFPAFRGPTRTLASMGCHASVLTGGHSPHAPHEHREEELLIPLRGEVELRIAGGPSDPTPRIERVGPGSIVYYPAGQHHTLRNPGTSPVEYLMFKWEAPRSESKAPLGTSIHRYGDVAAPADSPPFWTHRVLESPTSCLVKLHAHETVLRPGAGYEPHVDAYDVAILLLSGTVETLGQVVDPLSVVYYAAGEAHGMRNIGTEPARYLVFEFHAPGIGAPPHDASRRTLVRRVLGLGKRLARPIWHRLRPYLSRRRSG